MRERETDEEEARLAGLGVRLLLSLAGLVNCACWPVRLEEKQASEWAYCWG